MGVGLKKLVLVFILTSTVPYIFVNHFSASSDETIRKVQVMFSFVFFAILCVVFVGVDDVASYPRPRQLVNVDISIVDHALINDHSDLSDIALPGKS